MDCYSAESEFIESLDFLSPPVKRIDSSRQAFGSAYNTDGNDVHLLRDFRNKFAQLTPGFIRQKEVIKNSESSTSLVLKKTSEGQILGHHYSFISYPSLHKPENEISTIIKTEKKSNTTEKPLIQVTVIPKTDQVQAAKLLRRRRYIPRKIQNTASNHENSIQTKNVYLIVAGRRREKVYEIKTTGSAKFSTDHDSYSKNEDTPIAELTNFKQLIRSLNMDKKKKKETKPPPAAACDTSDAPHTMEWNNFQKCNNCVCVNDPRDRQAPKKSRVRIFGQFGISEEDKYVLRYGATVDDKTVMSDVAKLTRDFTPVIAGTSYGTTNAQSPQQQDSCLQADYNYDLDMEKVPVLDAISKESQGTQVNFNVEVATARGRCATFSDKKIQCSCCAIRPDQNTLKDCQSPMVIISVYPKLNPEDAMKSPAESARSPSPAGMNTYTSNQVSKTDKAPPKTDTKRNFKSPRRSRSPSPARKASKPKVPDNPVKGPISEKKSPDRQKALRAIKEKIREKDKVKQDASARKVPVKLNVTNATQVSKNHQNVTVSNATQVSRRNQRVHTASQATQISNDNYQSPNTSKVTQNSPKRKGYNNASSATQYYNEVESFSASTQYEETVDSLQDIAPIKHSINESTVSKRYQQPKNSSSSIKHIRTRVSNATQVPKQLYSSQFTQISASDDPLTISCATQVTTGHPKFIETQMAKNQETIAGKPAKSEQTSRVIPKAKAESGTNTDNPYARTKKALVESYTQKLTEQMIQKEYIPTRLDSSKVRINIDGDREYYDVLFNQDTLKTDLRIRKTLKDMDSKKIDREPLLGDLLRLPESAVERKYDSRNKSPTRSPLIVLSNNTSDDELTKHVSRISIRDSIEISHRREDRSNHNLKNTQTCFTACLTDEIPDESEFLAPMKHFTGDDCSIIDPIERDRQIRELLGVDKVKPNTSSTSQCRQGTCKSRLSKNKEECPGLCYVNYSTEGNVTKDEKTSAIFQQLVLNRNIQVFLQVEQFSKQKPIVLSRQQYDKKKAKCSESPQNKVKDSEPPQNKVKDSEPQTQACNQTSTDTTQESQHDIAAQTSDNSCSKFKQTEERTCTNINCKNLNTGRKEETRKHANIDMKGDCSGDESPDNAEEMVTKTNKNKKRQDCEAKAKVIIERDVGVGKHTRYKKERSCSVCCVCDEGEQHDTELQTYVLFNAETTRNNLKGAKEAENVAPARKTLSSVEIRYASVAFMKQAAYSSTDIGAVSDTSVGHINSFQTLFRGHKKCATPNLGTSAFSLYSEEGYNSENKCAKLEPQDSKPKKPFLRRLMSCLVMRSTRDSVLKLPIGTPPQQPSVNSSIDSYHISTSLGAVEVSSSIYDTSASFYSNHTILPITNKIKKGFFSSVRGFLTNRRS
ncbi:hypothetical protein PYW08_008238 [Mythimna loreyi]|uniref:Uncharacterized protein n=1 Tax=Mythimna loreyi TaxID=667449 RepID=A0ACC2QBE9_9NEOP|nr:hypothetical protein PYW08_008238 [Mythimna loreyi]